MEECFQVLYQRRGLGRHPQRLPHDREKERGGKVEREIQREREREREKGGRGRERQRERREKERRGRGRRKETERKETLQQRRAILVR